MDETESISLLEAQNGQSTQVGSFWSRNVTPRRGTISLMVSLVVALCVFTIISNWNGPVQPECYIENIHVLALDKTSNETPVINDDSIFFNLIFKNKNMFEKIYYETVNITFHHHGNSLPIGNISIPKFVVENKASVLLNKLRWEDARGFDATNGNTENMFEITLDAEYRTSTWYSDSPKAKIYQMRSQANVMVNNQGTSVKDKVWLSTQLGSTTTTLLWILVIVLVIIPLSIYFCLLCMACCASCCV